MVKISMKEKLMCLCMLVGVMMLSDCRVAPAIAKGVLKHNYVSDFAEYCKVYKDDCVFSLWSIGAWEDTLMSYYEYFEKYASLWTTGDLKPRPAFS